MRQPADPVEVFQRRFPGRPRFQVVAPGRVNIIGEHVDYCGGFVLPMAIDRSTTIVAAPRADAGPAVARIHSLVKDETVEIPLAGGLIAPLRGWAAYVSGVLAGFQERGIVPGSFDAVIDSTVPLGGGLSSSASLEVAVALLVARLTGTTLPPIDLALLCQRAEHEHAGVPCGVMDQCAAALSREGHLLLLDCRSLAVEHVPFARTDVLVLVADTNVRHALTDGGYARRRADCEAAARTLGLPLLRDATAAAVDDARADLGEVVHRRARHVVGEIARTRAAATALSAGRWAEVGALMAASHASLRDDFEVSCPELDALVEIAAAQPGVIGSRMTGGGFGGCTVTLVEEPRAAAAMEAIAAGYRARTGRDCTLFTTRPAAGGSCLDLDASRPQPP
jgi:galactokinase